MRYSLADVIRRRPLAAARQRALSPVDAIYPLRSDRLCLTLGGTPGWVKSKKKLAEMAPGVILAQMQLAQYSDYYYGYWFDDGVDEWYYWFTVDVIIVDDTWVEYY